MARHTSHEPVNFIPHVHKPSRVTPCEHLVEIVQYCLHLENAIVHLSCGKLFKHEARGVAGLPGFPLAIHRTDF